MRRFIIAYLLAIILLFGSTTEVFAVEKQDDTIQVDYDLFEEKDDYRLEIEIRNVSVSNLENVKVKNYLPEGYKLADDQVDAIKELNANSSAKLTLYVIKDTKGSDDETKNVENSNSGQNTVVSTINNNDNKKNSSRNPTKSNNANNGKENKVTITDYNAKHEELNQSSDKESVKAGDDTKILFFVVLLFIALIALFVLKRDLFVKALVFIVAGTLTFSSIKPANAAYQEKTLSVEAPVTIDDKKLIFKTDITYSYSDVSEVGSNDENIKRKDWIKELALAIGYENINYDRQDDYYNDIENLDEAKYIRFIAQKNALNLDEESFKPNEKVTREFMAVTAVKALGFEESSEMSCLDKALINEPGYVGTAISLGMLSLDNDRFKPTEDATKSDLKRILNIINNIIDSQKVEIDHENRIEYKPNVKVFHGVDIMERAKSYVIKTDLKQELSKGDIVAFNDKLALRISKITREQGNLVLEGDTPELDEVINEADVQEVGELDWEHAKFAKGVKVEKISPTNSYRGGNSVLKLNDAKVDVGTKRENLKLTLGEEITTKSGITIGLNLSAALKPIFKYDVSTSLSGINFKNLTLGVKGEFSLEGEVAYEFEDSRDKNLDEKGKVDKDKKDIIDALSDLDNKSTKISDDIRANNEIKFAEIPTIGTRIAGGFITLGFYYGLDGRIYFTCSVTTPAIGYQVYHNKGRSINNMSTDAEAGIEGSASVAFGIGGEALLINSKVLAFVTKVGFKGTGAMIYKADNPKKVKICAGLGAYLFGSIGLLEDCWFVKAAKFLNHGKDKDIYDSLELEFWNEDTSPLRWTGHFESKTRNPLDLKFVKYCSIDAIGFKGTLKDSNGHAIKDCLIEMKNGDNKVVATDKTDKNGKYRVETEKEIFGIYSVEFVDNSNKYQKQSGALVKYSFDKGEIITANLTAVIKNSNTSDDAKYMTSTGHYYKLFKDRLSWDEAKKKCEELGGHLATITSKEEQDFVATVANGTRSWIGGYRDNSSSREWKWVTGESWNYENWAEGEPNNSSNVISDENKVAIWPRYWNDLNNNSTEQNGYICEWENDNNDATTKDLKTIDLNYSLNNLHDKENGYYLEEYIDLIDFVSDYFDACQEPKLTYRFTRAVSSDPEHTSVGSYIYTGDDLGDEYKKLRVYANKAGKFNLKLYSNDLSYCVNLNLTVNDVAVTHEELVKKTDEIENISNEKHVLEHGYNDTYTNYGKSIHKYESYEHYEDIIISDEDMDKVFTEYKPYIGRYKIIWDEVSFDTAVEKSKEAGGHLVTITSKEEQSYIDDIISAENGTSHYMYWAGAYQGPFEPLHWITGEPFDYTAWSRDDGEILKQNDNEKDGLVITAVHGNTSEYGRSIEYNWILIPTITIDVTCYRYIIEFER